MSLRAKKNTKYNRTLHLEESNNQYWMEMFTEDLIRYDEPSDWDDEYWRFMYGGVNSMDEYYQMKLLNVLARLNVRAANDEADARHW